MPPRSIILAAMLLATACSSAELLPDQVRVRTGPGAHLATRKVVALPASCGALSTLAGAAEPPGGGSAGSPLASECAPPDLEGVDGSVRATLEFQGFHIIDSETLNATSRARIETIESARSVRQGVRSPVSWSRRVERRGPTFGEAPPSLQKKILAELGADGLLSTRIWIGAATGLSTRRTVEVQVRLMHVASGTLVWARRCTLEVGGLVTDAMAMERAARCATRGVSPQ
jgi:hypothetical protein